MKVSKGKPVVSLAKNMKANKMLAETNSTALSKKSEPTTNVGKDTGQWDAPFFKHSEVSGVSPAYKKNMKANKMLAEPNSTALRS